MSLSYLSHPLPPLPAQAAAGPSAQAQQWLEYAASCYLQGIKLGSAAARNLLPRLLYLLAFENDSGGCWLAACGGWAVHLAVWAPIPCQWRLP
jgi:hypothetical protein